MKNLTIFLSFSICFSFTTLNSQKRNSGVIYYKSKINSKELDNYLSIKRDKLKNERVKKSLDEVFLNTKSIKSELIFSDNKGVFKVIDKLDLDNKTLAQKILKTVSGGDKIYYYNENDKIYLIRDCEALGECFIFENKYLEWKLFQETKLINGYKSFKATRDNGKVIAWYTPSIPINFGPKGEYGLPGLILELEIGRIIFNATKIVLNPKEKIIIEELKDGKRVSYKEYSEIMNNAKKNLFGN